MRGPMAVVVAGLLAVVQGACQGAEDDCARDADCPTGSRCVKNGEHLVCLADGGGGGSGGDAGAGGTGGGGSGGTGGAGGVACPDGDADGVCDETDVCPEVADPAQTDGDGDTIGDACDECPADPWDDADEDGLCADADNCPERANFGQEDLDGDSLGDACDPDADGDGALEDDCAPLDAAVFPGAPDPCDGVDGDCAPGRCALGFDPEGAGWAVRDVTCAAGTRTCAVALRNGEAGRVVALGFAGTPETLGTIAVDGVRGVAIDTSTATESVLWAVLEGRLVGHFLDGTRAYDLVPESQPLLGPAVVSPTGAPAIAIHESDSKLQFWSPRNLAATQLGVPYQCQEPGNLCLAVSLAHLTDGDETLDWKSAKELVVHHRSLAADARTYVTFADDPRIAVAFVSVNGILRPTSGLLTLATLPPGAKLGLTTSGSYLFAVSAQASFSIVTANDTASHSAEEFALAACPTALLARDTELLVASRCDDGPSELITLPILDGLPDQAGAATLPLAGCTPLRLVETPQLDADGPDAVLVGCEGTATVLVLGRD